MAIAPQYHGKAVTPLDANGNPNSPTTPTYVVVDFPSVFASAQGALIAGDNLILAPVAGFKFKIVSVVVDLDGSVVDLFFKSDTPGARISATTYNSTRRQQDNPAGLFITVVGEGLYLNLSLAAAVASWQITYFLIPQ